MKRRTLLGGAAAMGAVAAASTLSAPAIAQGRKQLSLTLGFPKGFPGFHEIVERIGKRVELVTDGRYTIRIYGAGELVGGFEGLEAVGKGTVDAFYAASYYWSAKSQAFNFFTAIPFGMVNTEHWAWMEFGGGRQLHNELYAKFNVKPFSAGHQHLQWGGWFNKPINTIEDLRGLKIRISGLGGEVYKRVGATGVMLSVAETPPAMQSGAIDAVEQVSPWVDQMMGYNKVAKYYYYPGWQEPAGNFDLGVNLTWWNSLPARDQQLLSMAIEGDVIYNMAQHFATNVKELARLKKENPQVTVGPFPDAVLERLGAESYAVLADLAAKDADFKKIYDSYMPFLRGAADYTDKTEHIFTRVRNKALKI
jgi:TRAP-type mannitol/chloroaromatic compound transport system substrate-binding protein